MRDLDDRIRSGRRVRRCHIEVRILEPHMPLRTVPPSPGRACLRNSTSTALVNLTEEDANALGAEPRLKVTNCLGRHQIALLPGVYGCCETVVQARGILFLQEPQEVHLNVRLHRLDRPSFHQLCPERLRKDTMGHDFVLSVAAHKICAGIIIDIVRNVCRLHSAVHKIQFERRGPRLVCPFRQIHGYVLAFKRILVTAHIQGPVDF
mmetsp:Transcript_119482/g.266903  ORF Transcript_119482/g.266903 Transcript_119482/m.266903 type:complete len:207 (-) Transcript_119482:308-928(-)